MRQDIPLKKMTKIPGIINPILRSGCNTTKTKGIIIKNSAMITWLNLGGIVLREKYHAIINGIANFIISLGCILPSPGIEIQRFAPNLTSPTTKTKANNTIEIA